MKYASSVIAFDYLASVPEETIGAVYGAEVFLKSMKEYHVNEGLLFTLRPEELEAFLADQKLTLIEHLDPEAIERRFLTNARGALIGRMIGLFHFACASPLN